MTFYSDLFNEIFDYERREALAEREDDMRAENSDYAVNGESATLIPASDVRDADGPTWVLVPEADGTVAFRMIPGVNGEDKELP